PRSRAASSGAGRSGVRSVAIPIDSIPGIDNASGPPTRPANRFLVQQELGCEDRWRPDKPLFTERWQDPYLLLLGSCWLFRTSAEEGRESTKPEGMQLRTLLPTPNLLRLDYLVASEMLITLSRQRQSRGGRRVVTA